MHIINCMYIYTYILKIPHYRYYNTEKYTNFTNLTMSLNIKKFDTYDYYKTYIIIIIIGEIISRELVINFFVPSTVIK